MTNKEIIQNTRERLEGIIERSKSRSGGLGRKAIPWLLGGTLAIGILCGGISAGGVLARRVSKAISQPGQSISQQTKVGTTYPGESGGEPIRMAAPTPLPVAVEDIYTPVIFEANLYDDSHGQLLQGIERITGRSDRMLVVSVDDYQNMLEVRYESEGADIVYLYRLGSEEATDQLISLTAGYRNEVLTARSADFAIALKAKGLSVLDYARLLYENCNEKMEPEEMTALVGRLGSITFYPSKTGQQGIMLWDIESAEKYTCTPLNQAAYERLLDAALVP